MRVRVYNPWFKWILQQQVIGKCRCCCKASRALVKMILVTVMQGLFGIELVVLGYFLCAPQPTQQSPFPDKQENMNFPTK